MKAVPGRKTDVKDSEWIADLLKHGLLRGSFIPSRDQRELRELVRYRKSIIEERSREVTRIQKMLLSIQLKHIDFLDKHISQNRQAEKETRIPWLFG